MKIEIIKSKYIQRFLAGTAAIAVCIYFLVSGYSSDLSIPSEEIYQALEGKAEIVFDFGEYDSIEILNGVKGYFAVQENGEYSIIDQNGKILLNTEMGDAKETQKAGEYFLIRGSMQAGLIHRETLQMQVFEMREASLHSSGKYLLGKGEEWKVIDTESGKTVYESGDKLFWPQKEGYVIEQPEKGPHRIINLQTGRAEFEADKEQEIEDGTESMWLIQDGTCRFVLDAEYRFHDDWPLFRDAGLGTDIVIGNAIEDAAAADLKEYSGDGMYMVPDLRVYNSKGTEVYWLDPINIKYLGSTGNMLVTQSSQDDSFSYRIVMADGLETEITSEYYCYLPEDGSPADGYIPAYQMMFRDQDPLHPALEPNRDKAAKYRWTYLDENLQPVTDFVFYGASVEENGYAVVYNKDGYAALIDLQQRGGK